MARQFGRVVAAGFLTVAAIGAFHYALAQMANPPVDPEAPKSQAIVPTQNMTDYVIGMWLATDLDSAKSIAKLGQERASNPAVKEFAQTLLKDHEQCLAKLQKLNDARLAAIGGGSPLGGQRRVSGYRGPDVNTPEGNKAVAGQCNKAVAGQFCPVRFRQEVNQQLLGLIQKDMNQKQGVDFEKCFVMGEIFGHTQALAELQVARTYVSPELRTVVDDGIEIVQKHLATAKNLVTQLNQGGANPARGESY